MFLDEVLKAVSLRFEGRHHVPSRTTQVRKQRCRAAGLQNCTVLICHSFGSTVLLEERYAA